MSVIEDPYDRWEEVWPDGEGRTVMVGRVRQVRQRRNTVAEPGINHRELEPLPKAIVEYVPGRVGALFIQTPKAFLEGEEIAQDVTVFYDKDNEDKVVGI